MGIYTHETTDQLIARRAALSDSLHKRLTQPTAVNHAGSAAQYNQRPADIERLINLINDELNRREGLPSQNRPFYVI